MRNNPLYPTIPKVYFPFFPMYNTGVKSSNLTNWKEIYFYDNLTLVLEREGFI